MAKVGSANLVPSKDGSPSGMVGVDGGAMVTRTEWSASLALDAAELGELGVEVGELPVERF